MNQSSVITSRQTKYVTTLFKALKRLQHATNLELLAEVQKSYPEVSATTIHRVSARLKERGVIGCAPKTANGSERYDSNPRPHHHFLCSSCGRICDMPETAQAKAVITQLENLTKDCAVAGSLTMMGICKDCVSKKEVQI